MRQLDKQRLALTYWRGAECSLFFCTFTTTFFSGLSKRTPPHLFSSRIRIQFYLHYFRFLGAVSKCTPPPTVQWYHSSQMTTKRILRLLSNCMIHKEAARLISNHKVSRRRLTERAARIHRNSSPFLLRSYAYTHGHKQIR